MNRPHSLRKHSLHVRALNAYTAVRMNEANVASLTAAAVRESVAVMERKKAHGLDYIPIEIFQASGTALNSLVHLLINIWDSKSLPIDMAVGTMLMMHKKGTENDKGHTH